MTNILKGGLKFLLFILIWTCLGQVPLKGQSLEQHYHSAVNSETFQKGFWTLATPITWTSKKIQYLATQWSPAVEKHAESLKQSIAR